MLMARALLSFAGAYSLESAARMRSLTNGIVSAANCSLDVIGCGETGCGETAGGDGVSGDGAKAAVVAAGAGVAVADAGGGRAGLMLAEDAVFVPSGISSSVKYRNPPTPMATRHTTVADNGHIQFGVAAAPAAFFFTCGAE